MREKYCMSTCTLKSAFGFRWHHSWRNETRRQATHLRLFLVFLAALAPHLSEKNEKERVKGERYLSISRLLSSLRVCVSLPLCLSLSPSLCLSVADNLSQAAQTSIFQKPSAQGVRKASAAPEWFKAVPHIISLHSQAFATCYTWLAHYIVVGGGRCSLLKLLWKKNHTVVQFTTWQAITCNLTGWNHADLFGRGGTVYLQSLLAMPLLTYFTFHY